MAVHVATMSIATGLLSRAARESRFSSGGALGSTMVSVSAPALESKSLGELRQIAKEKGIRGDTKAEIIKLLLSTPGASTNGSAVAAAPASNGAVAAAAPGLDERVLQSMSLAQLRAMGRARGVFGAKKQELIRELLRVSAVAPAAAPPPPVAASPVVEPQVSAVAPSPVAAAAALGAASTVLAQQLKTKSHASLRAMARQRGIAGANGLSKEQLIQVLASTPSTTAAPPATASQSWSSAVVSEPVAAAPTAPAAKSLTAADLSGKSLSELRAIGKERGIRGDTKAELIALLVKSSASSSATKATSAPAAVQEAAAAPASLNIPFQSAVPAGGTTAIEPVQLATEVSALKQAMQAIQARDMALEAENSSLVEQANFLRNVLVGGIGLAVVPLLLPFQVPNMQSTTTTSPAPVALTSAPATETVVPTPVAPAPIIRELSPEDFCTTLPPSLLTSQAAKFCQAVLEPGL